MLALQLAAIWLWWLAFTRAVTPILFRLSLKSPMRSNVALTLCIVAGATGCHPQGPYGIRIAEIGSATYYTLAQNPVLFAGEALRAALVSREKLGGVKGLDRLPIDEALRVTREMIAPGQSFPPARYPLVRAIARSEQGVRLARPANVLVIFVEGLDRRYVGQTVRGIRVTPFLDRLKQESVYFEHFFTNGVQTSCGLFASFCFTAPLFIWIDDSLRSPDRYRPRTVSAVASQVDLAPTILGLNGLTPAVAPFLGRDLSCDLVIDCLAENVAFLSSVYDDMIGLADREGILFYSLRTETLISTDLALERYETRRAADDPAIAAKYRRLMGLYESANRLLDQNRIWSWTELGDKL